MFSYLHGFHAGNHADVIKHMCLVSIVDYLKQKSKPFVYFDSHAGAGVYSLSDARALKTKEFEEGINPLMKLNAKSQSLQLYLSQVESFWRENQYPGSPKLAQQMLREQDVAVLMEWHNNEVETLKSHFYSYNNVSIHHRDGFEGLVACLPHTLRRGMVLIDPPYERTEEYQQVVDCIKKALSRWSTGIFAIWYPLLEGEKSGFRHMLEQFARLNVAGVVDFQLQVRKQGQGMFGSGVCVINPPWQLADHIKQGLEEVLPAIAQDECARTRVNWLVDAK